MNSRSKISLTIAWLFLYISLHNSASLPILTVHICAMLYKCGSTPYPRYNHIFANFGHFFSQFLYLLEHWSVNLFCWFFFLQWRIFSTASKNSFHCIKNCLVLRLSSIIHCFGSLKITRHQSFIVLVHIRSHVINEFYQKIIFLNFFLVEYNFRSYQTIIYISRETKGLIQKKKNWK